MEKLGTGMSITTNENEGDRSNDFCLDVTYINDTLMNKEKRKNNYHILFPE